jgi:integrase
MAYAKSRRDAADRLLALQKARSDGMLVMDERTILADYLDWWTTEVLPDTVRLSTQVSYAEKVRHIKRSIGHVKLSKLGTPHVHKLMKDLAAQGLSPRGIRYVHAVLRSALSKAQELEFVNRNVARLVKAPPSPQTEIIPLSVEQAKKLLRTVQRHRLYPLYAVALAVGLRSGEALALGWDDVDLDEGTINVRRSLQRLKGTLRFTEPKSRTSRRTIPLPPSLVEVLKAHKKRQAGERLRAGPQWHDEGFVFTTRVGTPIEPRNLTRHFHALCKKAEIGRQRFHDLRHTCGSLLAAQGVHPRVAMEILGHSQISLTMNVYTHVATTLQREATTLVQDLLDG